MSPIGSRHAACVKRLNHLFSQGLSKRAIVSVQDPIRVSEHSEPHPDLALLQPHPDFYVEAHPGPQHVLLVVEVAETSAEYDRQVKLPLYARAGIAEVWLVDLATELIEIHRQPSLTGYEQVRQVHSGQRLSPLVSPELEWVVDEILG